MTNPTKGRKTNSKDMLSIVSSHYDKFYKLLTGVFVNENGKEILDFTEARNSAFNNILRDYDQSVKGRGSSENKSHGL